MGPFRPDPLTEWPHFLILPVKEKTKSTDMKIFKDVFSGDELFSDTYPMKLVDDCMWEVYGKHETRTEGEVVLEGSNASKKDYLVYLKDYMKKVVKYLEDHDRAGEVETFKKNINNYVKDLLGRFKDLQFYVGESMDNDAMIVILA